MKTLTKTLLLCSICMLFCNLHAFAQPTLNWVKSIGDKNQQAPRSIVADKKGNVYTLGWFTGTIDFDPGIGTTLLTCPFYSQTADGIGGGIYITKMDKNGELIWARKISGATDEDYIEAGLLLLDKNNDIYFSGSFRNTIDFDSDNSTPSTTSNSGLSGDLFVCKFSSDGAMIWNSIAQLKNTAGGQIRSADIDSKGNIYVAAEGTGESIIFSNGSMLEATDNDHIRTSIYKLDRNGNFTWGTYIKTGETNASNKQIRIGCLHVDSKDNVILTGGFNGKFDFGFKGVEHYETAIDKGNGYAFFPEQFILKIDSAANFKWFKHIGDSTRVNQEGQVSSDLNGNIFYGGQLIQTPTFEHIPYDLDPSPAILELATPGNPTIHHYQNPTSYIIKLDSSGNNLWVKNIGYGVIEADNNPQLNYKGGISINPNHQRFGKGLVADNCGNIYVSGEFCGPTDFNTSNATTDTVRSISEYDNVNGKGDFFISKLNSDGQFVWGSQFGPSEEYFDYRTCHSIFVDSSRNVYFTFAFGGNSEEILKANDFDPSSNTFEIKSKGYNDIAIGKLTQPSPNPLSFSVEPALICSGDSTLLTLTGGTEYVWTPSETVAKASSDSTFHLKPLSTSTYTVKGKSNGCPVTTDILITVDNSTVANAGKDTTICLGTTVSLNGSGGTNNFSWKNGPTTRTNIVTPNDTTTYIFTTQAGNCKASDTVVINVNPLPITGLSTTPIVIDQFESTVLTSSGGGTYLWTPADGLSCSDCASPTATPKQNENYCVTVTDANNCKATSCVEVKLNINCGDLFIPTGFSPNGDNINDKLEVKINPDCITEYNFMIFDRWGEKVFETTMITDSWDGKFNGKDLDNAVYVYYAKMKLIDSNDPIVKKGNVSIIK